MSSIFEELECERNPKIGVKRHEMGEKTKTLFENP